MNLNSRPSPRLLWLCLRKFCALGALLTGAALAPGSAQAQTTYYWDNNAGTSGFGTAGGTWSSTASLFSTDATGQTVPSGTVATGNTDTAVFGTALNGLATGTITVSGTVNIGNLSFGAASGAVTLSTGTLALGTTAGIFTVDNTSDTLATVMSGSAGFYKEGTGTLIITNNVNGNTIAGSVFIDAGTVQLSNTYGQLGSGVTNATIASGAALVFSRNNGTTPNYTISGAGTVSQISGGGAVTLNKANTYTGGTTLSGGTLNINAGGASTTASAIGTGAVTISGGTIDNTTAATVTLGTNNAQNWNGNFGYAGTRGLNLGTGAVTLGANVTLTTNVVNAGAALTVGGVIGDGGNGRSLTKAGAGILFLGGTNTYSGGTTVSAGLLTVTTGTLGTGALTLADLAGTTLTLQNANAIADSAILTFGNNSVINLNAATGTSETIAGLVDSTSGATFNTPGTYSVSFLNTQFGNITSFASTNGEQITIAAVPEPSTWLGAALLLGALGFRQQRSLTTARRARALV